MSHSCQSCHREFRTWGACCQHMNDTNHWQCATCDRTFTSQHAANQHMDALGHHRNYCKSCDRFFQNENNLKMHLNSKIHRGSSIPCPFCRTGFATATGVAHHLETGSCLKATNVNRETIYKLVRQLDPHGIVTHKMIGWREEDNSTFSSTYRAYNGYNWECYLCHRVFTRQSSLDSHLNSPVHKQKLYHCPNVRGGCAKQFVSLAALFNHLESESCAYIRFEKVQEQVGNVFSGRMLTFR